MRTCRIGLEGKVQPLRQELAQVQHHLQEVQWGWRHSGPLQLMQVLRLRPPEQELQPERALRPEEALRLERALRPAQGLRSEQELQPEQALWPEQALRLKQALQPAPKQGQLEQNLE